MSNTKKEVKSPNLIMSLVKKSQAKGVIITSLMDNEVDLISVLKTASLWRAHSGMKSNLKYIVSKSMLVLWLLG